VSVSVVILAAGLSTRYGRLKQLDGLGPGGESILEYNIYDAVRAGFDRVVLIVRPEIERAVHEHVLACVGDAVEVKIVNQTLDHLPEGFRAPPDRLRPWGTGHAVLCAKEVLDGPFAVCNSDDLYGPGAFKTLYKHLSGEIVPTPIALVGYTLEDTLSGHGGVSRAVAALSRDGLLSRLTEIRGIHSREGHITGRNIDGSAVELSGDAVASMNLWGFAPKVLGHLERQFRRFLETWGSDTDAEFYISTAVNGQIQVRAASAMVLHAEDHWFGVTHAEDRDRAEVLLAERINQGVYPERLRAGFSELT